jgi:cytolysin-activating lysine-acyltransferase
VQAPQDATINSVSRLSDRLACNAELQRVELDQPPAERDETRVMSGALFLRQHSCLHSTYPADMFDRRIGPSLPLGQFRYYTDGDGVPAAFCSWVWLSAAVLAEVLAACRDLEADEFRCGDLPFFYEFLAPFGHCRAVVRDLRDLPFAKGRSIPSLRVHVDDRMRCTPRLRHIRL